MNNKNVTIIGGAGFLAKELVIQLLEKGYRVTVADISITEDVLPPSLKNCTKYFNNKQLTCINGDITDKDTLNLIPHDTNSLIHIAGYFRFWPIDNGLAYKINIEGTKNVCHYAANHPCIENCLYYSSVESIGTMKDRAMYPGAKENTRPLDSELKHCLYKQTKTKAHDLVEKYFDIFEKKGKRLSIHAPPTPFGPGMETVPTGDLIKKDTGLINWISPKTILSCAYTGDIARDSLLILEKGLHGKTYVSVGFHASIPEILETKVKIIREELGMKNAFAPKFHLPNWSLPLIAKSMEFVGNVYKKYTPEMTLEQAIRTTQNHWYDTSMTRKDLGLNDEYLGLYETVRKVCIYLYENKLFGSMASANEKGSSVN